MKGICFAESVWAKLKLTGAAALALAFVLGMAGCPLEDDPEPPAFVPVTGITGVPVWAEAGVALSLPETAEPANATNQTIVWSTTASGAVISGNQLTAAAAGTVTLTAAIVKGKSDTEDFTKDFTITVYPAGQVPAVTGVTVNPSTATVEKGGAKTFTALVHGPSSPLQAVTWTVTGGSKAGTSINENGRLTVASDETAGAALTVTAVSSADPAQSGTAEVSVIEAGEFIPIEQLAAHVAGLPENTAATYHTVKLDRVDITKNVVMGKINRAVTNRYITVDLSACSATDNTISGNYSTPGSNDMNVIKDNRFIVGIILPGELTAIGSYAFNGCSSLASVDIPEGVKSIGNSAFSGCSSLASVVIPGSVTSIGSYAFYVCSSLASVVIPGSVTSIGANAFSGCSNLCFTVTDPGSYRALEEGKMLMNNTALIAYPSASRAVVIPEGVTAIGEYAFSGCASLTGVAIPGSVTSIGSSAFNGCRYLASVAISEGVESIGKGAFDGCTRLASVDIPGSVTSIGESAFRGCSSLTSVTIPGSVTSIGESAFRGCSSLTSVTIPGGVKSIGHLVSGPLTSGIVMASPFYGCTSLASVTILEGVESIGSAAFYGCNSLASVTIPASVTAIGNSAFSECSLASVTIPASVTSIGESAFARCGRLASVDIPEGVKSIGNSAFSWCGSLASVDIPGSVTAIGVGAFSSCRNLASVTIPGSVTAIGAEAFSKCSSLASVTILEGVISIGNGAFDGCSSLASVVIPGSVTSIGGYAFARCGNLRFTVTGTSSYHTLEEGKMLMNNTALIAYPSASGAVTIPGSVGSIRGGAFEGCGLVSVTILEGVTSIEDSAFFLKTSLTSVVIPGSVASIGDLAFYGCSSLTSVRFDTGSNISAENFNAGYTNLDVISVPFPGNLRSCYLAAGGGAGTYTRTLPATNPGTTGYWTKQP